MKLLVTKFKKFLKGKTLFLGMGNSLKGDDAAGLFFLEKIKQSPWAKSLKAEFWSCLTSPENYLEKILRNDFDTIVLIDALHMNKEPGRIDLVNPDKINSFSVSTHSLSPKMFVDYLRNQRELNIRLLGIQPKTTTFKEGLSSEVSSCINKFIEHLSDSSIDRVIELPFSFKNEILALGGQLKSTFCLAKDNRVFLSKTLGDLENEETLLAFGRSIDNFKRRFQVKPKFIACDLHPEYLSTKYAQDYVVRYSSAELIKVQHHHAHIASCMLDNNMKNQKVIGIAFDGTGFGSDGNIWGGEFLLADYKEFKRIAHFDYIPLVSGAKAIEEPWRIAAAYLYKIYGDKFLKINIDFIKRLDKQKWAILEKMIDKNINAPLTSSIGRLFDTVSSLVGIRDTIEYEGQAAIELEQIMDKDFKGGDRYRYKINDDKEVLIIDSKFIIKEIVEDFKKGFLANKISLKFHNTIVKIIVDVCKKIRKNTGINQVVLSGGVFQNKYLYKRVVDCLNSFDFKVLTHKRVPATDAGICLGQAAVAKWKS